MWLSGDHGRLIKWHQPDNFQFTAQQRTNQPDEFSRMKNRCVQ